MYFGALGMVGVHGTRFDMFRFFRMLALSEQGHGMEQRPRMVPASPLAASQRLPDDAAVTLGWGGRYVHRVHRRVDECFTHNIVVVVVEHLSNMECMAFVDSKPSFKSQGFADIISTRGCSAC